MKAPALVALGAAAALGSLMTPSAAAARPAGVYEWGKPVAPGAPGKRPTLVQPLSPIQIDAGNFGDVLVESDGTVWSWGGEQSTSSMTPIQEPGVRNVVQRPVDGNGTFMVIEEPGTDAACPSSSSVVSWSRGMAPAVVPTLNCVNVVQLAKAGTHTYALTASGDVFVWGSGNGTGALGLGPGITQEALPTLNPYLTKLTHGTSAGVEITSGMTGGGILVNGKAWTWGGNEDGQCGCGSTASIEYRPTPVTQHNVLFTSFDEGGNTRGTGHFLAQDTTGAVWAWGANQAGQLGNGSTINSYVPVPVLGLPGDIVDLRAGGSQSLALDATGAVWAWGLNQFGQVGDGTTGDALLPIKVLRGVTMISAGALHSLAA